MTCKKTCKNKTCKNKTCKNKTCKNKTSKNKTSKNKTCKNKTCKNKTCKKKKHKYTMLGGGKEDELPFLLKEKLKEKNLLDLYPLIMKDVSKQDTITIMRTKTANDKIQQYRNTILSHKDELKKSKRTMVTRSQANNIPKNNIRISHLTNEISRLQNAIDALNFRIINKFKGIPLSND